MQSTQSIYLPICLAMSTTYGGQHPSQGCRWRPSSATSVAAIGRGELPMRPPNLHLQVRITPQSFTVWLTSKKSCTVYNTMISVYMLKQRCPPNQFCCQWSHRTQSWSRWLLKSSGVSTHSHNYMHTLIWNHSVLSLWPIVIILCM